MGAGVSPEAIPPQSHSLPSSVSDALEAMGMEDLNLEDLEAGGLRDDPQEVCVCVCVYSRETVV